MLLYKIRVCQQSVKDCCYLLTVGKETCTNAVVFYGAHFIEPPRPEHIFGSRYPKLEQCWARDIRGKITVIH